MAWLCLILIMWCNVASAIELPMLVITPPERYEIKAEITAYWNMDPVDASGTGIAADGTLAEPNKTVAVDRRCIPLQSQVYIPTQGWRRANDTGSAIITKGNKICYPLFSGGFIIPNAITTVDLCMGSRAECYKWGRRTLPITFLAGGYKSKIKMVDTNNYKGCKWILRKEIRSLSM